VSTASAATVVEKARRIWSRMPFKAVILIAVLLQFTKEAFPFSHFPMYSSLSPSADYMFVTDGNDQPIPVIGALGTSTGTMKKMYKTRMKAVAKGRKPTAADKAVAARQVLAVVVEQAVSTRRFARPDNGLKLYRVEILRSGERIQMSTKLLAMLPAVVQPRGALP